MNLPVRLHIKMETMTGVSIETMPNIATVPIFLSGGEMRMLYGEDLKDYFNIDNLQFKGYSKNQYRNTGQLPEGFYRFVVEVRHHTTGRLISNQGMATAWFALGKPPVLKMPVEKAELGAIMGMPVTFSWIPNNVGIPSAGIQYNFELWEMRIPGIDPYVIAQSMPVKYSATQLGTNLVVYPEQLMLDPGMQYAWRVTAFDPFGNIPFDQKGHSQIRTFTYQCQCDAVQNFEAKRDGQDMSFSWTPELNHTSFNIEVENPESGYHTAYSINDAQVKFPDIDFGKTYRLRVQAICNGNRQNPAPFTEWKSLTIPEKPKVADYCPECDCGGEIQPVPVTSNTLRNELKAGDLLTDPYDGGSRYTIKSVIPQGDGAYKGRFLFWAEVWNVKILCDYWNLTVNTDNQILSMNSRSVYNPQFLLDVDAAREYGDGLADAVSELAPDHNKPNNTDTIVPIIIPDKNHITLDTIQQPPMIVIRDENNEEMSIPTNEDGTTTITDTAGNTFVVDKDGNVTQTEINTSLISSVADSPSLKPKVHYLIEGHKFYSGDTIFLPLSNKRYEIKAYRDSVNLFRNGSVWKGVTSADSAKVYFTPNVVSANINGTAISTIYNDSLRSDTLQCKIVVVSVEFEEDPSQKWGFDENDTPKEDLYSSYKNTLPISGIKWKSVRSDGSYDKLRIKISPIGAEKSITLMLSDSTNYDVRPKLLNANQQTIEVKSNVNVGDAALFAKVSFFLNDTIQVKIKGYDLVTKKVAIITVNESNDDIQNVNYGDTTMLATTPVVSWGNNKFLDTTPSGDDYVMYRSIERDSVIVAGPNKICDTQANNTDIITTIVAIANIQAALTDRYKYAVVEFVVDPSIYTRTINYDFNKNGMIDIRVSNTAYLDEMKRIVDSCKIVVPNLYNLFIVDYPNNSNTNGIMLFNQSFGFFFPKKVGGSSPSNISATAAHEVGHGTFGLRHPWDKQELHIGYPYRYAPTSNWTPKDINNLMEWDGGWSRDKLRKYQWDKIVR